MDQYGSLIALVVIVTFGFYYIRSKRTVDEATACTPSTEEMFSFSTRPSMPEVMNVITEFAHASGLVIESTDMANGSIVLYRSFGLPRRGLGRATDYWLMFNCSQEANGWTRVGVAVRPKGFAMPYNLQSERDRAAMKVKSMLMTVDSDQ